MTDTLSAVSVRPAHTLTRCFLAGRHDVPEAALLCTYMAPVGLANQVRRRSVRPGGSLIDIDRRGA